MIVYITRHGQTSKDLRGPNGQAAITPLGREQARLLGERLRREGFSGRVFSSPHHRCLETAQIVCEVLDLSFHPVAAIGEVGREWVNGFVGYTADEIKKYFSRCVPDADLEWPWWPKGPEEREEVRARVRPFIEKLCAEGGSDVLLVGHGASSGAAFFIAAQRQGKGHYNAALSAIEVSGSAPRVLLANDFSHFGPGQVTSNSLVIDPSELEEKKITFGPGDEIE